jgi:hypothetical protein
VGLGLLLVLVERVHQLGREDLLRARVHLLLARGQALLLLTDRQVADNLGELVDVTGLDLVPVVLEPAIPVLRHLGDVVREHVQDLLDGLLVDDPAETGLAGVLARDHHRHVVVKDLDRQVLALLPEDLLLLLFEDLACPMVRVDDVVADLEVDALGLDDKVLDLLFRYVGNDSSSFQRRHPPRDSSGYVCR